MVNIFNVNKVMLADSYKYGHYLQYEDNVTSMYDYAEARSVNIYDKTLFVGLQYILKIFTKPITLREIDEAEMYAIFHGISFNREGWLVILNEYNGFLPVIVKAIKEGTIVDNKMVLYTIESSVQDKRVFWIVSWLETILMKVWYPCSVATRSFYVKNMLIEMAKITCDEINVDFQFHNFGDRGATDFYAASIGGFAHLTCFKGTDNFHALKFTKEQYNVKDENIKDISQSIDASEHSSITSWGKDREQNFVLNFLEKSKNKFMIACVGDSYDIYNFTNFVTSGVFKQKIESDEYPIFVIRPDSGNAREVINNMLDIMERNEVAYTINKKGYKVFKKYRIIWGDGINIDTMRDILSLAILRKYSTENFAFGSGGWLMQQMNRDFLGYALKCSNVTKEIKNFGWNGEESGVNFVDFYVYKEPITDFAKKSKKGRVTTYQNIKTLEYFVDFVGKYENDTNIVDRLEVVFKNGQMIKEYNLFEIRESVNNYFFNRKEINNLQINVPEIA